MLEDIGCEEVEVEFLDYNMLQFEELSAEHIECLATIVEDPPSRRASSPNSRSAGLAGSEGRSLKGTRATSKPEAAGKWDAEEPLALAVSEHPTSEVLVEHRDLSRMVGARPRPEVDSATADGVSRRPAA